MKKIIVLILVFLVLSINSIVSAATANELESNNGFSTANLLTNNTDTYGYISSGSDVDFYKIIFTQNTFANFFVDVPNNINYDLYVYDQAWGLKWTSTNGAGIDELLTKKVVVKGMYYYVKVVPALSTQYSLSSNYILKVRQYSANEYYGALGWSYPTTGSGSTTITSTFGNTGTRYHKGIDLGVSYQPVFATEAGTILHSRVYSTGEKAVAIKTNSNDPNTDDNIIVRYLHLNSMSVSTGNIVSKGQQIGVSGNTGSSTGPHLHLDTNNKLMEYPGDYDTFNPKYFWPTIFGITTFNHGWTIQWDNVC